MDPTAIDIDKLSPAKRKLLSRILRNKIGEQGRNIIRSQEKREYYPLSFNQEQLWFLDTLEKGNPFYNVPIAIRFKKEVNIESMQAALNEVVNRHLIFKTYYIVIQGKPYQKILPAFTPEIIFQDLQGDKNPETQARERLTAEAKIPFNPGTPPIKALLFRLSPEDYILMLKFHHILIDGWSIPIFNREFLYAYQSIREKKQLQLPCLNLAYADFSLWQRRKIQEQGFENQLQYWKSQLSTAVEPLDLPTNFPRPKEQSFRGKRQLGIIPPALVQQLKSFIQGTEYSLFMLIVAGFSILLSRYSGKKDIHMGTQMANRANPGMEPLIGYFSNSVVLRFQAKENTSFNEFLQHVKEVTRQSQENQELPFEKLVQELRVPRTLGQNPLFQVMLVYQTKIFTSDDFHQLNVSEILLENDTAKFDLDLLLTETLDKIDISIIYNSDIFIRSRIERMISHLENILASICHDPGQLLDNIDFLTQQERKKILSAWNNTTELFPHDKCLHTLFEETAVEEPGAFCLYFRDRCVTRKELEEKANQLAWYLKKHGIGPNILVALCIEKSIEMVIGLIAILKAGGGYLPIDPTYPPNRIEYMLTQSQPGMILTQHHLLDLLPDVMNRITCLDTGWEEISGESNETCPLVNRPEDIVYGIFTSGSTGNPKMALLDHRGRVNNFTDFNRRFNIGKHDRILAVSSLGFDMCAYDVLGSLACGSAIVLPEPEFELQPAHWAELMVRHEVTLWHSVPSKLELLTDYIAANPAYIPGKCRLVLLGGDWIPLHLPDRFREFVPEAVMVSLGGATEVSMDSTIFIIKKLESTWKSIPYGKPMANQLTYIIDAHFNLVPEGIPGELCIGGVGIGWGYSGNPALTAEKFIPNPWSQIPGDRMYRTGDLARYNADGVLELLGRIDHQVKIRGYRIELGEIEAVLNHHKLIDKALVMAKKDPANRSSAPKIIAYVIPLKDTAQNVTPDTLRHYLKDRLPEYFIPSVFIFLNQFPLTPNGKIDRRALQQLDPGENLQENQTHRSSKPPESKIERLLAEAWRKLLHVDNISIDDNFFSLGGDSIKCIQLVTRAREAGLDITLKQIFRYQTIAQLAKDIEKAENIRVKDSVPITAHQYVLISQMNTYTHPLVDSIWLELPPAVTPELCKQALNIITRDYDCFKLRFQSGEAGWWQSYDQVRSNLMYFTHIEAREPETGEPASKSGFDQKTAARTRENIEKVMNLLDGPLLGAVLFTFAAKTQSPLLHLAVPRLVLSGISRDILLEDLTGLLLSGVEENTSILERSLVRGSFIKWANDNRETLFNEPVPVHPHPGENIPAPKWRNVSFALELNHVPGIKKVMESQPLVSTAEIILSALCRTLAQEDKMETVSIDLLLSTGRKFGKLPPPGSHGDFFTLQARSAEFASTADWVKWVHHFMAVINSGKETGTIPRPANNSSAVSVHLVETGISPGKSAASLKIKQARGHLNKKQPIPVGLNGLQLTIKSSEHQILIDVVYDQNVRSAAAVEKFYESFREVLDQIPAIYSTAKHLIYTQSDFPGTGITSGGLSRLLRVYPGLSDIYAPGPMQQYMLHNWRHFAGKGLYVIQYAFYMPASLDITAFEKSWQQLVRRHDILRTVFYWKGFTKPVQVVLESMELSIKVEDWRKKDISRQKKDLVKFMESQRIVGFDLENGPLIRLYLLRLSETRYLFIQFNSYLILDGWSVFLLRKELLALYRANASQTDVYLEENHRYRRYIDWVSQQNPAAAHAFWNQALQGIKSPTLLHQVKENKDRLSQERSINRGIETQAAVIDRNASQHLQRISRQNRITFNAIVMGGWYLVLREWLKQSDLVFGVTSSGRPASLENVESIVGLFVNTIPLRLNWDTGDSFIEESQKIGEYLQNAAAHEYVSPDKIQQSMELKTELSPLFDTVLVFDNYPVDRSLIELADQETDEPILPWDYLNLAQVEIPLRIAIWTGNPEQTSFIFSYYRDKFAHGTIAELKKELVNKLALIAESPDKAIEHYLT